MYDLRHTAGVLLSDRATALIAAVTQALQARSLAGSGSGVRHISAIARRVAPQVRKSLAVTSSSIASRI